MSSESGTPTGSPTGSPAGLPRIVRFFWVDSGVCLDQRKCIHEAVDLLQDRPEAGGPHIVADAPEGTEQTLQVLNAAWVCPVGAIKVEFEDGSVHDNSGSYIRELCRQYG